jgi:parallel beta-helix repeat protein
MSRVGKCLIAAALAFLWLGLVGALRSIGLTPHNFSGGTLTEDTTLTSADSPYLITQDIVVPAGVKLTLEPGTILRFIGATLLVVEGELQAVGSSRGPVTLTRQEDNGYWGGILLLNTNANNQIEHVVVEHVSNAPYGGVTAVNSRLNIEHSDIRWISGTAVSLISSTAAVRWSQIHDTLGTGNIDGVNGVGGYIEVEANHIYSTPFNYDGIDIDGSGVTTGLLRSNIIHDIGGDCIDVGSAIPHIKANQLYRCTDKGISLDRGANAIIVNNLIHSSDIGIASKDGAHPVLINNTIADNGKGLALYHTPWGVGWGTGYATVYNSIIWGNDTSILLRDGAEITVTYSDVQTSTVWPGVGNMNADPQFWMPAAFDYRLRATSPCTDTADPTVAPATDIRGVTRHYGAGVDMGAFEFFERAWSYLPLITN